MKLLFDKYRIRKLDDIEYHKNIANILKSIDVNNIPHMLIYGPDGCGKKTLLYSFLGYEKKKKMTKRIKTSSKEIPFTMYWNSKYIEFDVKEMGMYGKFIIRDIIQSLAQTRQIINDKPKLVILHHVELLSMESQYILNNILESHLINCKFILVSDSINNINISLQSNCLCLRINSISEENIRKFLLKIIEENKINITKEQMNILIKNCNRNLKKAILELETFLLIKTQKKTINQTKIDSIIKLILKKKITLNVISKITNFLYEFVMDNNMSTNTILIQIYYGILEKLDKSDIEKKKKLTEIAVEYDVRLIEGSKDIMHIQAFIFNVVSIIKGEE